MDDEQHCLLDCDTFAAVRARFPQLDFCTDFTAFNRINMAPDRLLPFAQYVHDVHLTLTALSNALIEEAAATT